MCSPLLTIFGFYSWLSLLASDLRSLALANSVDACQAIVFQNINHKLWINSVLFFPPVREQSLEHLFFSVFLSLKVSALYWTLLKYWGPGCQFIVQNLWWSNPTFIFINLYSHPWADSPGTGTVSSFVVSFPAVPIKVQDTFLKGWSYSSVVGC